MNRVNGGRSPGACGILTVRLRLSIKLLVCLRVGLPVRALLPGPPRARIRVGPAAVRPPCQSALVRDSFTGAARGAGPGPRAAAPGRGGGHAPAQA